MELMLTGDPIERRRGGCASASPTGPSRRSRLDEAVVAIAVRVAGVPSDLTQINKRSVHRAFDVWGARAAIRAGTELQALARHTETAQRFSADAVWRWRNRRSARRSADSATGSA